MNTPSLTRHLLLKDLRHQRAWLALVWLAALLVPFLSRLSEPFDTMSEASAYLTSGLFLLIFLVLIRLIRIDAPGREIHYLSTRPVAWTALLASKTLFIALFLLVPVWVAKLGTMLLLKIPVNFTDTLMIMVENTIRVGALLAATMLFSLFLRGMARIFLAMFGAFVVINIAWEYLRDRSFHRGAGPIIPPAPDLSLNGSRLLMCLLGIIATVGVVAILRYRRKALLKPLASLAAGLGLSLLAWNYWPCDYSRFFADQSHSNGELPAAMRNQIKFNLTETGPEHGIHLGDGGWNGIYHIDMGHAASLQGVEPPYYACLADYHAEATLKSGRKIRCSLSDLADHAAVAWTPPELLRQLAGYPVRENGKKWSDVSFEVFHYVPEQFPDEDFTGATIKGVLTLEIRRAFVLKTIPFKSGGEIDLPRKRWLLQDVRFAPGDIRYKMLKISMKSTLRGDDNSWSTYGGYGMDETDHLSWLVFNRVKNEYLVHGSSGGSSSSVRNLLYDTNLSEMSLARDPLFADSQKGQEPIPADWADDAQIIFLTSESCGRISFPYEIKNVDLTRK